MKRYLLSLIAVLLGCCAFAQGQMSVRSFKQLEGDQTATLNENKRISKQLGTPAAIIKVRTNQTGFNFDGGTYYSIIGDLVYKPGEIWVYIPERARNISISHLRFGRMDYNFPIPIQPGRTYEMVLDPGIGKYVSIQTSDNHSAVFVDNDSIGISPIYNEYIPYGPHKLFAKKGRMEGSLELAVVNDGDSVPMNVTIPMVDQSPNYGKVIIVTDPDAEIFMNGELQGVGQWSAELYKGNYTVETRKVNCDEQTTHFTVEPQSTKRVEAVAPVPHKGYVSLYTRPADPTLKIDNKDQQLTSKIELPVGHHVFSLSHKGYYDTEKEYEIRRNETVYDTINLKHIQYVTSESFYFGGAYTIGSFSGATAMIGFRYKNIDLQLSYMLGLNKSDEVNYYATGTSKYKGTAQYSLNTISAKLGYQIVFSPTFGLTPQLGYAAHMLSGSTSNGSVPSDDISAACATVGARFVYAPMQRLSLFVAPEYDIAVSKGKQYTAIADCAGFSTGGFFCNLGLMITF